MAASKYLFLLGLSTALSLPATVQAGRGKPDGFNYAAPSFDDYCFYTIYSDLSSYTFADPGSATSTTPATASASASASASTGGSGDDSSSHHGHRLARRRHGGGSAGGPCNVTVEVTSLYASTKKYCNSKQIKAALPYWKSLCVSAGSELIDLTDIEATVTDAYIATLPIIDPTVNTTTSTGTISTPVLLSASYFDVSYHTNFAHDYAFYIHYLYTWGLMGFWIGILGLGVLQKLIHGFFIHRSTMQLEKIVDTEGARSAHAHFTAVDSVWQKVRTWLVIPAALEPFLSHHQKRIWWKTIPRRLDFLINTIFWILVIVLSFAGYDSFSGNLSYSTVAYQNWQMSADRTGVMSYGCLPFLWLFGGRNNIFLWATNFSFRSFNIFHRSLAWAATILAIVHSINYTVLYTVYSSSYKSSLSTNYFYMGIVATVAMSVMLVLSHAWIRQRSYEFFLISHILLAVLTIYALIRHTNFQNMTWEKYLWPVIAIWCFDRLLRIVRLVYCNLRVTASKSIMRSPSSIVTYEPAASMLRIEITADMGIFKPGAGQVYYLYQPVSYFGWESHPFTLGAFRRGSKATGTTSATPDTFIFYVRPYNGWTLRLQKQCQKQSDGVIRPKLLIEGPYGEKSNVHLFDTVLYFVGGTGIAAAVPYIEEHIERAQRGAAKTSKIQLIWSTKQQGMLESLASTELQAALRRHDVEPSLYCTSLTPQKISDRPLPSPTSEKHSMTDASSTDVSSDDAQDKGSSVPTLLPSNGSPSEKSDILATPIHTILSGRPDVRATIAAAVKSARESSTTVAVLVCGPDQMADDARRAVHEVLRSGFTGIEYFEETFGW